MAEHILADVANWIKMVISSGGYVGIALLMAIESACIPLPSEIIMPFAGALTTVAIAMSVHRAPLDLNMVALAGAIGCALGSSIAYLAGATLGREAIFKYGRYILLRRKEVEHSEKWFHRYGPIAVFVSRLLPVVRTFISLPAGIARMPFLPFIALSFLGSLPWCYVLGHVGIQFANHLDDLKKYFHGADALIVLFFVVLAAVWIRHHLKPDAAEPTSA